MVLDTNDGSKAVIIIGGATLLFALLQVSHSFFSHYL